MPEPPVFSFDLVEFFPCGSVNDAIFRFFDPQPAGNAFAPKDVCPEFFPVFLEIAVGVVINFRMIFLTSVLQYDYAFLSVLVGVIVIIGTSFLLLSNKKVSFSDPDVWNKLPLIEIEKVDLFLAFLKVKYSWIIG